MVLILDPVRAYVPILTTNDNLVRWHLDESGEDQPNIIERSVEFFTSRVGTPDIPDQGEGVGGEFEILRVSFRTWEIVGTSRIDFNDLKLTDQMFLSPTDNTNVIGFDETNGTGLFPPGSGIIALTLLSYEDEEFEGRFDGRIKDADLIFNGAEFDFGENGEPDRIDLQSVATHEIGHICGLDHSFLQHTDPVTLSLDVPTMYPFIDLGDTRARSLEPDDIAGITELYPDEEIDEIVHGSISGRVTRAVAKGFINPVQPLFGVDIVAYQGDTPVVSTITRTNGVFRMFGVPAGEYILRAIPVFPSFLGLPQTPETDIQSQFFDSAGLSTDASPVTVTAGRRRFSLNFELPLSTVPDFFEPNDSSAQATSLAVNNGRMIHQFYREGDEDWVRFNATAGSVYDVITDNLSFFADPLMVLYEPDGATQIAQNDDVSSGNLAARIRFTAGQTGPYFVRLTDAGNLFGPGTSFEFSVNAFGISSSFDTNDDGVLDSLDLLVLASHWQTLLQGTAKRKSMRVDSTLMLDLIVALGTDN
jgi:hypothetical protein